MSANIKIYVWFIFVCVYVLSYLCNVHWLTVSSTFTGQVQMCQCFVFRIGISSASYLFDLQIQHMIYSHDYDYTTSNTILMLQFVRNHTFPGSGLDGTRPNNWIILTRFTPLATIVAEVYHCHFLLTIKNLKDTNATFSTYMLVDNLDRGFDL